MGSGCANDELTQGAKKAREIRRREKTQRKRLSALGLPAAAIAKLTTKQLRELLQRPNRTKKLWAAKK
jgi:hypothetical protein